MKEIKIPVSEIENINIKNKTEVEVITKDGSSCILNCDDTTKINNLLEMIKEGKCDELIFKPLMY